MACSTVKKLRSGVCPSPLPKALPSLTMFQVTHQAAVAERFMLGLHTITGNLNNLLARRPFFVFWFMGQISRYVLFHRCFSGLRERSISSL